LYFDHGSDEMILGLVALGLAAISTWLIFYTFLANMWFVIGKQARGKSMISALAIQIPIVGIFWFQSILTRWQALFSEQDASNINHRAIKYSNGIKAHLFTCFSSAMMSFLFLKVYISNDSALVFAVISTVVTILFSLIFLYYFIYFMLTIKLLKARVWQDAKPKTRQLTELK